jgi:hypothetical protein
MPGPIFCWWRMTASNILEYSTACARHSTTMSLIAQPCKAAMPDSNQKCGVGTSTRIAPEFLPMSPGGTDSERRVTVKINDRKINDRKIND